MEKLKILLKWYNLTAVIVILFVAVAFASIESKGVEKTRPDIINIDSIKVFGDLERPSVLFLHDKHTDAVEKSGGDCKTCHTSENDKMSQKFMGWDDKNQKAAMDNFHINCIGCHEETSSKDQVSGPVACADCHQPEPAVSSSRQPTGLDNSLHYRHAKAYENKCEACHTDCKTDIYKKGEETTCRHCHNNAQGEDQGKDQIASLENAVHESCITCHMTRQADKKDTGPVKCAGCHDLEAQKGVEKVSPVPRMERQQPDVLMLKTGNKDLDEPGKNRMDFVAFNHKAHENYNDTCRVCHHESMSACNTCHTVEGSEKSKGVSLEQAMHKMDRNQSCTGCHEALQHDAKCAGCHGFLSKNREQTDASCLMCHAKPPVGAGMDEATARAMIEQRPIQSNTYDAEDIPEKIIIKELSDKYEPVEFPHRQIVNKIAQNIKDNKLAAYFHADKGTLCQGCHHNSPATNRPTSCKSCHGKPFNEKDMNKPGIMGAYHIQCMECHTNMKIDQVGCTDCHEEKK
ncbi:MAG: sulfate respiration complex hexadecaheme cytochrome HmcA [Thermodesulfobacteriota bacterium]